MFSLKNVLMIGSIGIVLALLLGVITDIPEYNFSRGQDRNYTINSGEWSEKGEFIENTIQNDDGSLELDKYSSPPEDGEYRFLSPCENGSSTIPGVLTLNASNIQRTGENRRNVVIQLVETTPNITTNEETVLKEFYVSNGVNNYDFSDVGAIENCYIRFVFHTETDETPYLHNLDYNYTVLRKVDYGIKDIIEFFTFFLLIVVVAGVGHHNSKVN